MTATYFASASDECIKRQSTVTSGKESRNS